jgi:predicted GIY-YIG superfamily endonuclease
LGDDWKNRLLKEVGDLPSLYILQAEDSTVYVGQSKALGGRLKTHRTSGKIGFNRILAMVRDQSLAQYLDYAEAKIYDELTKRGLRLDQADLSAGLETKRTSAH